MRNGFAILKACMEDQPDEVNRLFSIAMAEKVGAGYDAIQQSVGRAIGRGERIDYDAAVSEGISGGIDGGVEYANPGETPPTIQDVDDEVGLDGTAPLGGGFSSGTVVKMPPVGPVGV